MSDVLLRGAPLDHHFQGSPGNGKAKSKMEAWRPPPPPSEPTATECNTIPDTVAWRASLSRSIRTLSPIILGDVAALVVSGIVVQSLLSWLHPSAAALLGRAAPLALLPLIFAYWLHGLYAEIWSHPVVEFRQLTHVTSICLLAAAVVGLLLPPLSVWCGAAWIAVVVLVPLTRTAVRLRCSRFMWWGYPTLVIGAGKNADEVARILLQVPRSGLRPVVLTDVYRECNASVLPVVNEPQILESVVRSRVICHAVVSLPDMSSAQVAQILERYCGLIAHLLVLSDCSTLPTLWGASRDFGRLSGIEIRNSLLLHTLKFTKRAFDCCAALLGLLVGMPMMLLIAASIKATGEGPVFFGHERIGRNGKLFKAWKFRTMRKNAEDLLREHLACNPNERAEWKRSHKLRQDPRVTRVGGFLRRTSLDELPQLWNVLKGDMSIVGPRPIVGDEVRRYGGVFRLYTTVKPGITGLWQVSGRNDVNYQGRVLLDQFYIRHWSPWLDIYVLAKTIVAVLFRHGAY